MTQGKKQFDREIALLEAEGKSSFALRQQKLEDSIAIQKQEASALKTTIDLFETRAKALGQSTGILDDLRKQLEETNEAIKDQENQLAINVINNNKKKLIVTKNMLKTKEKADEEAQKNEQKLFEEGLQKEIDFFNENKLPILQAQADKEVEIQINKYSLMGEALEAQLKKEEALRKRNQDFAVQTTLDGLSLISDITELFGKKGEKQAKKAFQVQKAAQIATATIETYLSAQKAYTSQLIPGDPTSPIRAGIAAGVAVAAGLANIAKIASQKFEGGGSSGGGSDFSGGGVGGGEIAPQFNVVGDAGINQLAQLQQQPTQAFVVSGEVTSAQALDRNRVTNATL